MTAKRPFTQVNLNRRSFLFLGSALGGGLYISQVVNSKDEKIWLSLYDEWTRGWRPIQKKPLRAINEVLKVIREDKRSELNLALKLLSVGPICFLLTGYFNPWGNSDALKKILLRWRYSKSDAEKKLFSAFSAIINSAFYGDPNSWQKISYPGPPEFERIRGTW